MALVRGSCPSCREPLVFLKCIEGKPTIIVSCSSCEHESHFDLQSMLNSMNGQVDYEEMLANFEPRGLPN